MWFLNKKRSQSVVLFTIDSSAVAGAYVHYEESSIPVLLYTVRHTIHPRQDETSNDAMLRTLDGVGKKLIETGAPVLRRETGSGSVSSVLISVGAPWQDTSVRTETIAPGKPFIFSKKILSEVVASSTQLPENRVSFGQSVIATILNGYDIPNPLGKSANRAEIVVLHSTLDKAITDSIQKRVRALYHTHTINFTAFAPVAYATLRDMYPHNKDFLVLDVSGESSDLVFIKNSLLVQVGTITKGINALLAGIRNAEHSALKNDDEKTAVPTSQPGYVNPERNARFSLHAEEAKNAWLAELRKVLTSFATLHALPRTLFLLADPSSREYLRKALDSTVLHSLWLSDEPLSIISVYPDQFVNKVSVRAEADGDVYLSILALYHLKKLQSPLY